MANSISNFAGFGSFWTFKRVIFSYFSATNECIMIYDIDTQYPEL